MAMTHRQRQRAFAASALTIAAATATIAAFGGSRDSDRPKPPRPHTARIAQPDAATARATAATPQTDDSTPVAPTTTLRRERAQARRLARRFIATFARYQHGQLDNATIRSLRALATPELANYLIAQPPRGSTRERTRPHVTRLDVTIPARGRVKAAALLTYGTTHTSLFEIALERTARGWQVAEIYPAGAPQ